MNGREEEKKKSDFLREGGKVSRGKRKIEARGRVVRIKTWTRERTWTAVEVGS